MRKSGRAAECVCFENRFTSDGNGGSNPSSSEPKYLSNTAFSTTIKETNAVLRFSCLYPVFGNYAQIRHSNNQLLL